MRLYDGFSPLISDRLWVSELSMRNDVFSGLIACCTLGLLLTSLSWCSTATVGPEGYSSHVWHVQDGLPDNTIQALAQTADGYLWIGTSEGLVRFDGVRFTVFDHENTPALSESNVTALAAARDGSLWIGTQGNGLLHYRWGEFQRYSKAEGITNDAISSIYEDHHGTLWAGTEYGLFRLEGNRFVRVDRDKRIGFPGMQVRGIAEDYQGRMWFVGTGIVALTHDGVVVYQRGPPGDFFRSVLTTPDGTVWAGSVTGLVRLDPHASHFRKIGPQNRVIETLAMDSANNLWIGTMGGLVLDQKGRKRVLTAPKALPGNQILTILEDSGKNLWFGTSNGLSRWSPSGLSIVKVKDEPGDESISTVYQDPEGPLWVVTASERLYKLRDQKLVLEHLPDNIPNTGIRNVFRDRIGAFWIGTHGLGVVRIYGGKAVRYTNMMPNIIIRAFCEDSDGDVWIGTEGGLARFHDGKMEKYHPVWRQIGPGYQGLSYASTRALLLGANGDLWVGTDGGVSRFHDGKFVDDDVIDRLRGEKIWTIYEDTRGGIWLGSRNGGLFYIHQGMVKRFTTKDGLPSNSIYQILGDGSETLWLSSSVGVFAVRRSDVEQAAQLRGEQISLNGKFYGIEDGQLVGGIQPAGAIAHNGDLWLPSTTGVARVIPQYTRQSDLPPVLIEQVIADGQPVGVSRNIELAPGRGELEIHYTAATLGPSESIRFRYKLEGYDDDWKDAFHQRLAHYTNLRPGNYLFRAQVYDVNFSGNVSEARLPLRWKPSFYRTRWFIALLAASVAFVIWLLHRLRLQQERLHFTAVLDERNRLARDMHDTLIHGCVGSLTLLQAARKLEERSPETMRDLLGRAREQMSLTIEEARLAIWNLRHPTRPESNFVARLFELASDMNRSHTTVIRVRTKGKSAKLGSQAENNLLLVAREALLNALLHANPTCIDLDLQYKFMAVEMSISDDGCGFEPASLLAERNGHYGLMGMRERVDQLGGYFQISSSGSTGTVVKLRIPKRRIWKFLRGQRS